MAPLPDHAPTLKPYLTTLLTRTHISSPFTTPSTLTAHLTSLTHDLLKRSSKGLPHPGAGVTEPNRVPNKTVFILIGLIGAGFVITGIWFFFWAKNGGFFFQKNDWDDYKSTVLRRKGPNGTTLSGATESTDLGGGSVVHGEKGGRSLWGGRKNNKRKNRVDRYKDFDEESSALGTEGYGGSTLGSEMGLAAHVAAGHSSKHNRPKKEKTTKPKKAKKARGAPSDDGTVNTELDVEADVADAMRAYRHEKPARVGGLNKQPDGSSWDGSNTNTNAHDGSTAASELLSHRERTPTNTPNKSRKARKDTYTAGTGGIRKVVSTSEGAGFWGKSTGTGSVVTDAASQQERIKAEAKRLQEKGRAAQRRDFSFNVGDDHSTVMSESVGEQDLRREQRREERERRRKSRSPTKRLPGSYHVDQESLLGSVDGSGIGGDVGTKSYHHPIPGLSSAGSAMGSDYVEERRRRRNGGGGYRRERGDSLSE